MLQPRLIITVAKKREAESLCERWMNVCGKEEKSKRRNKDENAMWVSGSKKAFRVATRNSILAHDVEKCQSRRSNPASFFLISFVLCFPQNLFLILILITKKALESQFFIFPFVLRYIFIFCVRIAGTENSKNQTLRFLNAYPLFCWVLTEASVVCERSDVSCGWYSSGYF